MPLGLGFMWLGAQAAGASRGGFKIWRQDVSKECLLCWRNWERRWGKRQCWLRVISDGGGLASREMGLLELGVQLSSLAGRCSDLRKESVGTTVAFFQPAPPCPSRPPHSPRPCTDFSWSGLTWSPLWEPRRIHFLDARPHSRAHLHLESPRDSLPTQEKESGQVVYLRVVCVCVY